MHLNHTLLLRLQDVNYSSSLPTIRLRLHSYPQKQAAFAGKARMRATGIPLHGVSTPIRILMARHEALHSPVKSTKPAFFPQFHEAIHYSFVLPLGRVGVIALQDKERMRLVYEVEHEGCGLTCIAVFTTSAGTAASTIHSATQRTGKTKRRLASSHTYTCTANTRCRQYHPTQGLPSWINLSLCGALTGLPPRRQPNRSHHSRKRQPPGLGSFPALPSVDATSGTSFETTRNLQNTRHSPEYFWNQAGTWLQDAVSEE